MKKLLLILAFTSATFTLPSCDALRTVAGSLGLSDFEMIAGLKEALTKGLFRGFDAFVNPNAGNPVVRFVFPGEAAKIEKTLRDLGLSSVVNKMTSKFTDAMSLAVNEAKPIFVNAVRRMNINDAASILITKNQHAATEYFKAAMKPELMNAFLPIVDSTVKTTGADRDYQTIARAYNSIPFLDNKLETNINNFIAARAIDGMFLYVANEEENIRSKLEFRTTDLLKKVFGYADQQLNNRPLVN